MRESKTLNLIAGVATLGIWAGVYLSLHNGLSPSLDRRRHEAVGWMLARQAAEMAKGGEIIVFARDTSSFENPASDIQLAAFRNGLAKAGLSIASLQSLQVDPLRPVEVPPGDFFTAIKKAQPGSVIVSLMGPPLLTPDQINKLSGKRAAIIAFCSGLSVEKADLKSLFDQGLLQAAIVDRPGIKAVPQSPSDLQSCFDHWFVTVRSSEAATTSALATQQQ